MGIKSACVMALLLSFMLHLKDHSVRMKPAFFKMRMQRQALNQFDQKAADDSQLFMNLFRIMGRKLGSGAYGEVWMAVDNFYQRQVACKIVRPGISTQVCSGKVVGTLWREVNLLKDMSHVRAKIPFSIFAHQILSQISSTSSVSFSPKRSCMEMILS